MNYKIIFFYPINVIKHKNKKVLDYLVKVGLKPDNFFDIFPA